MDIIRELYKQYSEMDIEETLELILIAESEEEQEFISINMVTK